MAKDRVSDRILADDDRLIEVDRRIDANYAELTDEERALIKRRAREHVLEVQRKRAEDMRTKVIEQATERALRDAEKEAGLHGAFVDITVDLAPCAGGGSGGRARPSFVMLDGTMYYHGQTYEVPFNVANTLIDVMARTWEHENEINARPRRADQGRRHVEVQLSPRGIVSNTQTMPAV